MKSAHDFLPGLISAAASVIVVIGALSLALAEGFTLAVPTPAFTAVVSEIPMPEVTAGTRILPSPTPQAVLVTATIPFPTTCPVPLGWEIHTVQTGDTLAGLALLRQTSVEVLKETNCLVTQALLVDTLIYLPPLPSATPRDPTATSTRSVSVFPTITPIPCGAPLGWVRYIVQPGDTLFKLSIAVGVSIQQIQFANCMGTSTLIRTGEGLWLPMIPVIPRTPTPIPSNTLPPAPSATKKPPTAAPTEPPEIVPSPTPVTPEPTVDPDPQPSSTPVTPIPIPSVEPSPVE